MSDSAPQTLEPSQPFASTSARTLDAPLDPVASTSNSTNNNPNPVDLTPQADTEDVEVAPELTQAELEEKWRIYEMISEEYHDIVTELPLDYQRTFMLMKELDDEQTTHTSTLKSTLQSYLTSLPTLSPSSRSQSFSSISKSYLSVLRSLEDKHNLSLTLYESIDRHIQRLDTDLAMYEDSLVIGLRKGTLPSNEAPSKLHAKQGGEREDGDGEEGGWLEGEHEKEWGKVQGFVRDQNSKKKGKKKGEEEGTTGTGTIGMPIDPNEPTYCYCNRVSFGEMIRCDNDDCQREWFHLECLDIDKAPAGEWYCRECLAASSTTTNPNPSSSGPLGAVPSSSGPEGGRSSSPGKKEGEDGGNDEKKRKRKSGNGNGKEREGKKRKLGGTSSTDKVDTEGGGDGDGEGERKKRKYKKREKKVTGASSEGDTTVQKEKGKGKGKSSSDNKDKKGSSSKGGDEEGKANKPRMGRPPKKKD